MISSVKGKILEKDLKYLVIDAFGIGFKVFCTTDLLSKAGDVGSEISINTHLVVKEDALDLYGFANKEELSFFEKLISISGIGPKSALNILSITSVQALKKAINSNDISHLVKVSGIGKKMADKIVLELRGKVSPDDGSVSFKEEIDAIEALKSLGYNAREARDALNEVDKSITSVGDRVKHALKILGK